MMSALLRLRRASCSPLPELPPLPLGLPSPEFEFPAAAASDEFRDSLSVLLVLLALTGVEMGAEFEEEETSPPLPLLGLPELPRPESDESTPGLISRSGDRLFEALVSMK